MSLPARIVTLLVAFAAVVAGAVFIVIHYLGSSLASGELLACGVRGSGERGPPGGPAEQLLQRARLGELLRAGSPTKAWVHTTLFSVPKNTRVNMTILGYDGCTPLRNNFWSLVQGTVGGGMTVQQFKTVGQPLGPAKRYTGPSTPGLTAPSGHTFAIPSLHLFVPMASPNTALFNKVGCTDSPCTAGPHSQMKFSFMTPNSTGAYRWQCFMPCGGGYLDGNGGPMQTSVT